MSKRKPPMLSIDDTVAIEKFWMQTDLLVEQCVTLLSLVDEMLKREVIPGFMGHLAAKERYSGVIGLPGLLEVMVELRDQKDAQ